MLTSQATVLKVLDNNDQRHRQKCSGTYTRFSSSLSQEVQPQLSLSGRISLQRLRFEVSAVAHVQEGVMSWGSKDGLGRGDWDVCLVAISGGNGEAAS